MKVLGRNGVVNIREIIISKPDNLIVIEIFSSRKGESAPAGIHGKPEELKKLFFQLATHININEGEKVRILYES